MKLTNTFRLDRPAGEVFDALGDIERVAECLPGARPSGSDTDGYMGEFGVRVGSLKLNYGGRLRVLEADPATRVLRVRVRGTEAGGAGPADAYVTATVRPDPIGTVVTAQTELTVRGRVAELGRGVITDVAASTVRGFAIELERMLAATPSPTPDPEPPGTSALRRYTRPAAAVAVAIVAAYLVARCVRGAASQNPLS